MRKLVWEILKLKLHIALMRLESLGSRCTLLRLDAEIAWRLWRLRRDVAAINRLPEPERSYWLGMMKTKVAWAKAQRGATAAETTRIDAILRKE